MSTVNNSLGVNWTFRILGFMCLGMDLTSCALIKENPAMKTHQDEKKKKLSDIIQLQVLKDTDYVLWIIGSDIALLGYFIPFYFLPCKCHQDREKEQCDRLMRYMGVGSLR
jgi:hypothetical protein